MREREREREKERVRERERETFKGEEHPRYYQCHIHIIIDILNCTIN